MAFFIALYIVGMKLIGDVRQKKKKKRSSLTS
jgi:hypothetical protein